MRTRRDSMDINKTLEVTRIEEIKILNDIRLINNHDLNSRTSTDNLTVQFTLTGEVKGNINCYLCLDDKEVGHTDRSYLLPLFIEAMNILIGKQISYDTDLKNLRIVLSTPQIRLNPTVVSTSGRSSTHLYELMINESSYDVLIQYGLQLVN